MYTQNTIVKAIIRFIPALFIFIVLFLVNQSSYQYLLHPQIWYIFLFFVVLDILILNIVNIGFSQGNFINFYLASTVVRMVLVMIFMGVFMYFYPENRKLFLITSVVLYLFFTIFEISVLLRKLRRF